MKNTFGASVSVTIFGESHGPAVGAVLDGMAPGVPVDEAFIAHQLDLRRPCGTISTARREPDKFEIVSGVFEGRTTGTPLCVLIRNEDTKSRDYAATRALARPGHADYAAYAKYRGSRTTAAAGTSPGASRRGLSPSEPWPLPRCGARGSASAPTSPAAAGSPTENF